MSDLQTDAPAPAVVALPAQRRPALPTAPLPARASRSLRVRVTPLRWSLPAVAYDGGLCLRLGPLRVRLARR